MASYGAESKGRVETKAAHQLVDLRLPLATILI